MRPVLTRILIVALAGLGIPPFGRAGDGVGGKAAPALGSPAPTPPLTPSVVPADEAQALGLVRQHLPELAGVLEPLKKGNPAEYQKAIVDLTAEARKQAELRAKNPARADLALADWKARTRVELVAAQLAGSPSPEKASQLHQAIEERVDQTILHHRFEVDQSEANVARLRENLAKAEANRDKARTALQRVEAGRDARIENRYQSLLPKKKAAPTKPKAKPPAPPATPPPNPVKSSRVGPSPNTGGGAIPLLVPIVPDHAVAMPSPRTPDHSIPLLAAPALVAGDAR